MRWNIKEIFKPKIKLMRGTRFISFLFIGMSVLIAAGILFAANFYYNMDTGEIVMEEIQRVTQVIRATAGLIVGGSADQNPESGYKFHVVGNSLFEGTSVIGNSQELRFLEDEAGSSNYVAFKAPSGLSSNTTYILPNHDTSPPSADYVLTWQSGGQLEWKQVTSVGGAGDITQVGDVTSGGAFDGTQGNTLYFEGVTADDYEIALTAVDPTADYTITLPALNGTVALLSSALSDGGVLFASGGLIVQDTANLFFDDTNNRLGIGTNSPAYTLDVKGVIRSGGNGTSGAIRIYSEQGTTDYELVFQPNSSMTMNTVYTWPADTGSANYVLTTDGSGNLSWKSVTGSGGAGAVGGSGTANTIAKWTDAYTIGDSSITDDGSTVTIGVDLTVSGNLVVNGTGTHTIAGTLDPNYVAGYTLTGSITGSGSPDITGINQFSGVSAVLSSSVTSPLYTATGALTVQSGGAGDIILDSASGIIQLATGDYIQTSGGYEIGKSGTQILREMIPIMGFDLPVQCSTACDDEYAQISRTIEDYPFSSASPGTTRVHKFIIRYATSDTTNSITFSVYNATDSVEVDTFTCSATPSTDLSKGAVCIQEASIPTDTDDWYLRVQGTTGLTIKIYQIFLAAYDEIQ